jgi:glycosyltransferase involved in cell wall biosynthesis
MALNKPLVSIIIPVYNREKIVIETIKSVINQSYCNWECIIVDDFSTDNTVNFLKQYLINDNRFKIIQKNKFDKKGAASSRNIGLNNSDGIYIQFLDSDDILFRNKIESQLNLLKLNHSSYKTIAICGSVYFDDIIEIDNPLNFPKRPDYKNFNNPKDYFDLIGKIGGFYTPESFLVSKELINFAGYWNDFLTLNDDGEFFFRIILNSDKMFFDNHTLVGHRNKIGDNLSLLNSLDKAYSLFYSWYLIEANFKSKIHSTNNDYINKKKWAVYNELKKSYPKIIYENNFFFSNALQKDNFFYKIKKLYKRFKARLKNMFKLN